MEMTLVKYFDLKKKHQNEVEAFPMVFAFNKHQFEEAMNKLGLTVNDTDKIYSIGGGGYIRKTDGEALDAMQTRQADEMQAAIEADLTGEGFIYEMFEYELGNHEYGYTGDLEPTLDALNLTYEKVKANERLLHGLNKARKATS